MQTDATSHNIVACCWGFLANNVASVCMGPKVWSVSNYTQQVPTSANIVVVPRKRTQHVGPNNVASVCMGPKVWSVSNYTQQVPTSANIIVVPRKRTQHVGPKNVASVCMGLKVCWVPRRRHSGWGTLLSTLLCYSCDNWHYCDSGVLNCVATAVA